MVTCLLSVKWIKRFTTLACCALALCLCPASCVVVVASPNTPNPPGYLSINTISGCEPSAVTDTRQLDSGTIIERPTAAVSYRNDDINAYDTSADKRSRL